MGPLGVLMCDKLTKDLMCFECLCLSCNRLRLRRTKDAEEQRSKGSVKQLEQRNAKELDAGKKQKQRS